MSLKVYMKLPDLYSESATFSQTQSSAPTAAIPLFGATRTHTGIVPDLIKGAVGLCV